MGGLLALLVLLVLAAPASAAPPVCDPLALTLHIGESTTSPLACNDADGDPLAFTVATAPEHGSAVVDGAGSVTYYAPFDYAGPDPFSVLVDDQAGNTKTVQVTVNVTNTAPVCQPVDLGKRAHGPNTFAFAQVDCFDADGDPQRGWEIVDQPAHGTANVQFGSITYDPDDAYVGKDTFSYRVSDGAALSPKATVSVELTNSAPQCFDSGNLTIRQDKPATQAAPCSDPDGDALQLVVVDEPAHGTISGAPGPFNQLLATYDPVDGYRGADHMRLRVSDGTAQSEAFDVDLTITRNHAPECFPQTRHTTVGTAVDLQTDFICFDNDFQDSESVTVALDAAVPPEHGALAASADKLTYTPDANYTGEDEFGIKASDGDLTTLATVRLHVADTAFCSPAPTLHIRPGATKSAIADCTAPDFGFAQVSLVSQPTKGSVTQFFGGNEFRYTAGQNASGPDSFTFRAGTGELQSPVATQDVVIDANANEVPVCNESALIAYSGRDRAIFPFCSDADFDALTYTVSRAPSHGTTRKTDFGQLIYTPTAGYTGADDFEIAVTDGHGGSVTITQPVDVRPPQAPGCAPAQPLTVRPGGRRSVLLSCTNPQGDNQTYSVAQQGQKGTVTVTAGDFAGQFRYTADAGASGTDHFVLRATDAAGSTDVPVDVTIDPSWNTAPQCQFFGTVTVARDTTTNLPLASRCTDEEGDDLTFTRAGDPEHGTVTAGPSATLQYTPDAGYTGSDGFQYVATDARGAASSQYFLSLNVVASLNPSCTPQAAITMRPGTPANVMLSCTEPQFAPLTYEIVTPPAKGSLSPPGDSTNAFRTYTANAGATGSDSFTYRVRSSNGTSTTYTQSFTFDPNHNTAPTCFSNSGFPTPVTRDQPQLLFPSCNDADNDTLTFQPVTQPAHGAVTVANGRMTYTPAPGYTGPDEFTFTAADGHGGITNPVSLSLQVNAPQPPTCQTPDPMTVRTNSKPRFVFIPCQDPQSSLPTIVIEQAPAHGTIEEGFGSYYYKPNADYEGPDSFRYHAQNTAGSSAPVTQAITVDPDANEVPDCFAFPIKVKPGRSRLLDTLCGDEDGDTLTYEITSQSTHGDLTPQGGQGPFTYTADGDFLGSDSFTMRVDDGHGGTRTFTVSVTVSNENTPPTCASGFTISAQSGVATPLGPPPCTDGDSDALTFEVVSAPAHGAITQNEQGTRFYTSQAGYTGPDSFTFRADDGTAKSNVATVNVNVTPAPGPSCVSRSLSVPTDGTLDVSLDCFANGADAVLAIQTPPPAGAGTLGAIDQAGNRVRFTPTADFRGTTTFTFVGSSGGQTSVPATITITVTGRGFAPNVFLSSSSTSPRTGAPVTFTASASDPDGGTLAGYRWFVDGTEVLGQTASTLTRSFGTAGEHRVRVRVTDDEGDATEREVLVDAHDGNQAPTLWLSVPEKTGTGVPALMNAWAWDADDAITKYSWDFGDGTTQEGATLDEVTHAFTSPGTRTVKLTVTDAGGATVTKQAPIVVTDENTAPDVAFENWPDPALRGQPTWLSADVSDAENDAIAAVGWDLDGNGSYETDGGTSPQRSHTFTTAGDHTVGIRVQDGRGATTTKTLVVHVVNAPPEAKIAGPSVIDLGGSATYTDASTDEGTIVSRAWDTDNDGVFDDGTGSSVQLDAGSVTGYKTVRLRVTDNEGGSAVATRQITVRTPGPVTISDPVPPKQPDGGTVHIGTSTDPTTGLTTISLPNGEVGEFPNRCMPLDIGVLIRKAAGATVVNPVLVLSTPGGAERFPMTDADGDGIWTARLDCAVAGTLRVEYKVRAADGTETPFDIAVGKIVLIDPQGVVYDRGAFEAYRAAHPAASEDEARTATAVAGATVHLQRLVSGDWQDVNASDPGIDPNENPEVTGANGLYRWDVSDGTYRVRVSAPGFRSKISSPVVIPPPVLDLHIGLDRNPAPVAAIAAAGEAFRGQTVTFTSDSTDDGSIAGQRWDLDDDGDFDDGTTATVSKDFSTLGTHTVRLQVTDDEGAKTVAERVVTIVNRAPTAQFSTAPATGFRGQALQFVAQGDDPDPGVDALTFAWDTDGDGFDDGTGATQSFTFGSLGAKTVRVRATDADGGTVVAQTVVTIANRNPTVTLDGPATGFRGQDLVFNATGADADPGAAAPTFAWDTDGDGFDDGNGASKTIQFGSLGAKTVRVQATDADSGTAIATKSVTIENRVPTVSADGPATGFRGQDLVFNATGADADPGAAAPTFAWDTDGDGFDDGNGASKTISFGSLGAKTVRVQATDADTGSAIASRAVTIINRDPTVSVSGGPTSGFRNEDLTFTATGGDADPGAATPAFAWDVDGDGFDDGNGASKTVQFGTLGDRVVRVRATDADGGTAEAQRTVTIVNHVPAPTITGPATGFRGQDLAYTATSGDGDPGTPTFAWDTDGDGFDDGTGATRTIQFGSLGAKTVRVQVTDADGAVAAAQKVVTIGNRAPTASIAKSPAEPVDGDTVTFTATAADADPGAAAPVLAWDLDGDGFDDGTSTTASRAFAAGSHTARLRATDADGGSVTAELPFTVKAKPTDGGGNTGGGNTGGGNTGGGNTGGGGPAPDAQAPALAGSLAGGQKVATALAKGVKLAVTVDEACTVGVKLTVDKATARKLKLDPKAKKAVVVGTLTKGVAAGKSTLTVKLTAKARKAFKKAKSVKLGIALTAKDTAGNAAAKALSATLKK